MYLVHGPTPIRRFMSTLLSLALVACLTPSAALAAPADLGIGFVPTGAEGGAWVSSPTTITLNPSGQTKSVLYRYGGVSSGEGTLTTFPGSLVVTRTGESTVTLTALDNADASLETTTVRLRIDPTAPVSSATVTPSTWTSQTVSYSITSADQAGLSGLKELHYQIGATGSWVTTNQVPVASSIPTAGVTKISFFGVDNAGNQEATKSVDVLIDKTAPVTSSDRKASYVNTATITLAPTDAGGSSLKATYYQLNTGAITTGTVVTTTLTTPTVHSLKYWSVDNAGNVETPSTTVTFTVTTDASAPVTTLVTKPGLDITKWQSANVTFTLTATDTPAPPAANTGVASTFYRLDGAAPVTYVPGTIVTISKDGTSTLEYWSVDRAGVKETTKSAVVGVDKILPVALAAPKAEYVGTATISISATDTLSGVAAIKWWIGSGAQTTVNAPSGARTFKADAFSSAPGTQTLYYSVTDVVGNQSAVQSATFHETRQPVVSIRTSSGSLKNTTIPAKSSISGALLDSSVGVAGKVVVLEYSASSTFVGKRSVTTTTGAGGAFKFNVSLSSRTFYRVRFEGDADNQAALSRTIWFKPRVALSIKAPTTARPGKAFYVTGVVKPVHAKGRRVYVEWASKPGGKRSGYIWASIAPRGSYSNYSARLALKRGTWYVRTVAPDDGAHATTTTAAKRVVVK